MFIFSKSIFSRNLTKTVPFWLHFGKPKPLKIGENACLEQLRFPTLIFSGFCFQVVSVFGTARYVTHIGGRCWRVGVVRVASDGPNHQDLRMAKGSHSRSQSDRQAVRSPHHMGATARRHETVGATAKRPLDAPRHSSGHGESPISPIRPPSHAWRTRQDSKSGRRGASGSSKTASRPKRRSDRIPSPSTSGMPHAAGQSVPTRWHRR